MNLNIVVILLANPKCNTSACPKYKCATHLVPANLTAGECCDHCAPVSVKPATSTVKPTHKPKKSQAPSSSSSSQEEEEDNCKSSSSSEQIDGRSLGCNIRPFDPKPHRSSKFHL